MKILTTLVTALHRWERINCILIVGRWRESLLQRRCLVTAWLKLLLIEGG